MLLVYMFVHLRSGDIDLDNVAAYYWHVLIG